MPRYAVVSGSVVENVIVAEIAPTIPGRTVVALSAGQYVGPGDTYSGGTFTPYVPSAAEQERREDDARLLQALALLRQWAQEADVVANQGANVTQAQLKGLFGRFANVCRLLIRIIRRVGVDDGA